MKTLHRLEDLPARSTGTGVSVLGYLANPRLGSWTVNLIHHKGLAAALYDLGYLLSISWLMLAGVILLGHSDLDRVFGYSLEYPDAFQNTHLELIGKTR